MSLWSRFLGLPQKGELAHCSFRRGQLVCCIADKWVGPQLYKGPFPLRGCVYTADNYDDGGLLYLVEFPWQPWGTASARIRASFSPRNFRPVRETSIDCFTALLAKPPVRQKEDA
jgi:hypothetical protein